MIQQLYDGFSESPISSCSQWEKYFNNKVPFNSEYTSIIRDRGFARLWQHNLHCPRQWRYRCVDTRQYPKLDLCVHPPTGNLGWSSLPKSKIELKITFNSENKTWNALHKLYREFCDSLNLALTTSNARNKCGRRREVHRRKLRVMSISVDALAKVFPWRKKALTHHLLLTHLQKSFILTTGWHYRSFQNQRETFFYRHRHSALPSAPIINRLIDQMSNRQPYLR